MRTKKIILIVILFFSCEEMPTFELSNSFTDINVPESVKIESYDDNSISINFFHDDVVYIADSLHIERYMLDESVEDTTFTIPFLLGEIIIDSLDIKLEKEYYYKFQFVESRGFSKHFPSDTIYHSLPAIDTVNVTQLSTSLVELSWKYPYNDYFLREDLTSLRFVLNKFVKPEDSTTYNNTLIDTFNFSIDYENWDFRIEDSVELGENIYYEVSILTPYNESVKTQSREKQIIFPKPNIEWLPLNSSVIYLYWDFDPPEDSTLLNQMQMYLKNQYINGAYFEVPLNGSYKDVLMNSDFDITDDIVQYYFKWCSDTMCDSIPTNTKTLPIQHMQYIPSIDSFTNTKGITESTVAFYIDKYEVNNSLFDSPNDNPVEKWLDFPKTDISFDDAIQFCNNRSSSLNLNDINVNFRIPTLSEWEVAAGVIFDEYINIQSESIDCEYPMPICSDNLDCYYANFQTPDSDCFNSLSMVGTYNGNNIPYEYAASPSGIFDMSGNAKEWVKIDENECAIKGGGYLSSMSEISSGFLPQSISCLEIHPTIGFRTVVNANDLINQLKNQIELNK